MEIYESVMMSNLGATNGDILGAIVCLYLLVDENK